MSKIGFIGTGNMAEAIIVGILKGDNYNSNDILAFDISLDRMTEIKEKYNIMFLDSEKSVLANSEYCFLAVKPQIFPIIKESRLGENYMGTLISIIAGVDIQSLKSAFPRANIVRTMPNFPALIGEGMTGICFSDEINEEKKRNIEELLKSIGKTIVLEEKNIDALTGLSGSGPAFVFQFIEAMADAGVYCGLPRQEAYFLASQTVLGSAKMVLETGKHPGELKDLVTSPGGTTIEGIKALEKNGFRNSVMEAVISSYHKSKNLK